MAFQHSEQPELKEYRRYAGESLTRPSCIHENRLRTQTIKKVTVILPVCNKADSIERICLECLNELTSAGFDPTVICVDDASTDGTDFILADLAVIHRQISYIRLSRSFGKQAAILAGIQEARNGFQAIACMASDGQHDPCDLVKLLQASNRSGVEIICGTPLVKDHSSAFQQWLAKSLHKLFKKITGESIQTGIEDINVFRPKAVKALRELKKEHVFAKKGFTSWIGFQRELIPIETRPRTANSDGHHSIVRLFRQAAGGLISFRSIPLRLCSLIGLCSASMALAYMTFIIFQNIAFGSDVPGYATMVVLILGLGGIQLFSTGVLGEYVGRLYDTSKNWPHYIVEHRSWEK